MATDDELKAQILRYHFVEHWRVGTIASQLGVHHSTVERVLGEAGVERERQRPRRPSKLDSYMAFITETLERFPTLSAARLFDMVKARGYTGGPDHFRHRIAQLRPRRPREAYLRLRTLAGEQAQVDWAHFGKLTIGRAERPLMAFVVVLSYSRYPFVRFYLGASLANLIRGHVEAFSVLGGTAKVLLYDNMKGYYLVDLTAYARVCENPGFREVPGDELTPIPEFNGRFCRPSAMEGWQSGRLHRIKAPVDRHKSRGFESLPFRI